MNPYKPMCPKSIHRTRMTIGMLIGLLAATQGSVAFGAIRWGEAVLRQQSKWYSSTEAHTKAAIRENQKGWNYGCKKTV